MRFICKVCGKEVVTNYNYEFYFTCYEPGSTCTQTERLRLRAQREDEERSWREKERLDLKERHAAADRARREFDENQRLLEIVRKRDERNLRRRNARRLKRDAAEAVVRERERLKVQAERRERARVTRKSKALKLKKELFVCSALGFFGAVQRMQKRHQREKCDEAKARCFLI